MVTTFRTTAVAVDGIPHCPAKTNERSVPATNDGPP
jgi:hypothetical protein